MRKEKYKLRHLQHIHLKTTEKSNQTMGKKVSSYFTEG